MSDYNLVYLSLLLLLPVSLLLLLALIVRPRPVKIPIKNRHVFITGGSSGIGLVMAREAALEGGRVSILARSLDKLEEAKKSLRLSTGIDVATYSADVRDFDAVQKAMDEAGPIDILMVNQGLSLAQELEKQPLEEIKLMIDVNLIGTFNVIKAALPGMKSREDRRPASIAITGSQGGQVGFYGNSGECATKFGIRGLAEALQQEVIVDDIHLTLISPSDTDTPGLAEERRRRPEITKIIAAESSEVKADVVAKKAIEGIKSGCFNVHVNFDGLLLSIATAGLSPQRSFFMAFVEVVTAGIGRIAALLFLWRTYRTIEKWHARNRKN